MIAAPRLLATLIVLPWILSATTLAQERATPRVLDARGHHLGIPGEPEWQDLDGKMPEGRSLEIKFSARRNAQPATLFIRQRDVKLRWPVFLNGRKIDFLELNEMALTHAFTVPAGALSEGENSLSILSPSPEAPDDIFVDEIALDDRPPAQALREATVRVQVTEKGSGVRVPYRLTIVDTRGHLAPLSVAPDAPYAARTGVIYTGDGQTQLGLPAGEYTIYATRGFEYGVALRKLSLTAGETAEVALELEREVSTPELVACDTHIHSFTFSGHGDATADERAATIAGEGIELAIGSDHNRFVDYSEAARRMKVTDYFTCAIGNEVTTKTGHFIAFPTSDINSPQPDATLTDWPALMKSIRAVPGLRVVVLNHPRDTHNGFVPFSPANFNPVTGDNLRGSEFSFDAMELVNSGALQSDFMRSYRDWFALLNHGYRVTAVAASDSHDVSRFIVGQGRSYVVCNDRTPGRIDIEEACRSFKEGRVAVSLGLLTRIEVNGKFRPGDLATDLGNEITVGVTVLGPSWVQVEKVELFANGVKIREQSIAGSNAAGAKARLEWKISKPSHDLHLVAIASGPGVTAPYWAIAAPYQPTNRVRNPKVIGSTNPVWVDADGDGRFTAPRAYAEALVRRADRDPMKLIQSLTNYDESVSAQAAGLCQGAGVDVREAKFTQALATAAEPVRKGFAAFAETLGKK